MQGLLDKQKVIAEVAQALSSYTHKATQMGMKIPHILDIKECKGQAAGRCIAHVHSSNPEVTLKFNYGIAQNPENYEHFLNQTVPHELVHGIQWATWRSMDHGLSFRRMMVRLGCRPDRCHNYNMATAQTKAKMQRTQVYCGCLEGHQITPIRRRRMVAGKEYYCVRCKQPLRFMA